MKAKYLMAETEKAKYPMTKYVFFKWMVKWKINTNKSYLLDYNTWVKVWLSLILRNEPIMFPNQGAFVISHLGY